MRWIALVPWCFLAGVALAINAAAHAQGAERRIRIERWVTWCALPLSTLTFRTLMVPAAFFHQNGQGPMWERACAPGSTWNYGPGFTEMFCGFTAYSHPWRMHAVFAAQAILASTAPASAATIVRALGGGLPLAAVAALTVLVDPALARVSRSESYFSTIAALLFLAAATLVSNARPPRGGGQRANVGAVAAGLLAAQAMRLHPYAWSAAPLVGLALFAVEMPDRTTFRAQVRTFALFAATAGVAAASWIYTALHGSRAGTWLPQVPQAVLFGRDAATRAGLVLLVLAIFVPSASRYGRVRIALFAAAVAVSLTTRMQFARVIPAVDRAYDWLFAPTLLPFAVALLRDYRLPRAVAGALAGCLALAVLVAARQNWRAQTVLCTDVREQALFERWATGTGLQGTVLYLGRWGFRSLDLPIPSGPGVRLRVVNLQADDPLDTPLAIARGEGPIYYLHSSLCSTDRGSATCEALERCLVRAPLAFADLPAIPSMYGPDDGYNSPAVHLSFERVTGVAARAGTCP